MGNVFTNEQISEIMEIFMKTYGAEHRQYIGARYVPIFGRKNDDSIEWNNSAPYEPLTIVLHEGNSYTSRQYVPVGIDILNESYWANTGNYNAQVEAYRQDVIRLSNSLDTEIDNRTKADAALTSDIGEVNTRAHNIEIEYVKAYETVAAMKSDTAVYAGMIVKTNGFYEPGDGGASFYALSETGTSNEMDVIAIKNSLNAILIVPNAEIAPEQVGAKGTNVQTNDDTEYIQKAIDIASQKMISVKIAGYYYISDTIVIPGYQNFIGTGTGCRIVNKNNNKYAFTFTKGFCTVGNFWLTSKYAFQISDDVNRINALTLDSIWIDECATAFNIPSATGYVRIQNCHVYTNGTFGESAVKLGGKTISEIGTNYVYFDSTSFQSTTRTQESNDVCFELNSIEYMFVCNCDVVGYNIGLKINNPISVLDNIYFNTTTFFGNKTAIDIKLQNKIIYSLFFDMCAFKLESSSQKILDAIGDSSTAYCRGLHFTNCGYEESGSVGTHNLVACKYMHDLLLDITSRYETKAKNRITIENCENVHYERINNNFTVTKATRIYYGGANMHNLQPVNVPVVVFNNSNGNWRTEPDNGAYDVIVTPTNESATGLIIG